MSPEPGAESGAAAARPAAHDQETKGHLVYLLSLLKSSLTPENRLLRGGLAGVIGYGVLGDVFGAVGVIAGVTL